MDDVPAIIVVKIKPRLKIQQRKYQESFETDEKLGKAELRQFKSSINRVRWNRRIEQEI
jgi:hypothetical protein